MESSAVKTVNKQKKHLSAIEIADISRIPISTRTPFFVCRFNKTNSPFRFSVIAPKKIWKKASDRNRVKRRIREVVVGYKEHPLVGNLLISCLGPALKEKYEKIIEAMSVLAVYNRQT